MPINPDHVVDLPPVTLRQLLRAAPRYGLDPAVLCDGLGFSQDDLMDPDFRVSSARCGQFVQRFLARVQRPALGLKLGSEVNLVSWGLVALGCMACASSRDLLDFAVEFQREAGRLAQLRTQAAGRSYCIIAQGAFVDCDVSAFVVEETFAALVQICRQVVGRHFNPSRVDLVMERPVYGAIYEETFLCPVRFGQVENRVHFPADPYAVVSADASVLREVRAKLAGARAQPAATELEAAVLQAIRRDLARPPSLADLATALHTSERTLRRRLGALGHRYVNLVNEERRSRALSLIAHSARPLRQIASECGFADVRTLQRAVKRWTGSSPTQLRRTAKPGKS